MGIQTTFCVFYLLINFHFSGQVRLITSDASPSSHGSSSEDSEAEEYRFQQLRNCDETSANQACRSSGEQLSKSDLGPIIESQTGQQLLPGRNMRDGATGQRLPNLLSNREVGCLRSVARGAKLSFSAADKCFMNNQ